MLFLCDFQHTNRWPKHRVCGFQTERAVEVVKLPLEGGVENDITRDASAAAFDPLTPFFSQRPDEGGGGTYLPWANRPGVAATPTYLPKMRHTHPSLPPKNPKSIMLRCDELCTYNTHQ